MKRLLVTASLAWLALAGAADLSKPKRTAIPLVQAGPVIDGRLNDAVWEQASVATNFLNCERLKRTVSEQTEVRLCRDAENLYFGFACQSHDPNALVAEKRGRDAHRAYKDDVVEIMLDTEHSQNDFYQWEHAFTAEKDEATVMVSLYDTDTRSVVYIDDLELVELDD